MEKGGLDDGILQIKEIQESKVRGPNARIWACMSLADETLACTFVFPRTCC